MGWAFASDAQRSTNGPCACRPTTAASRFVPGFNISTVPPPASPAVQLHRNVTPQSIRRQMLA
jgi:hypothetical protein